MPGTFIQVQVLLFFLLTTATVGIRSGSPQVLTSQQYNNTLDNTTNIYFSIFHFPFSNFLGT